MTSTCELLWLCETLFYITYGSRLFRNFLARCFQLRYRVIVENPTNPWYFISRVGRDSRQPVISRN